MNHVRLQFPRYSGRQWVPLDHVTLTSHYRFLARQSVWEMHQKGTQDQTFKFLIIFQ